MYVRTYVRMYCTHVRNTYVHMYYMHVLIHVRMYCTVCMYVRTYVCMYTLSCAYPRCFSLLISAFREQHSRSQVCSICLHSSILLCIICRDCSKYNTKKAAVTNSAWGHTGNECSLYIRTHIYVFHAACMYTQTNIDIP